MDYLSEELESAKVTGSKFYCLCKDRWIFCVKANSLVQEVNVPVLLSSEMEAYAVLCIGICFGVCNK